MAQWSEVAPFFAGGSCGAGSNPAVATSIFFFLSSYFYPLAFYCLFFLLTLLASRDFCENVFLVFCFGRDYVPYHIVSLNREYLGGVHITPGRLSPRSEFTPVPSHGSIFVYMIPPQNVMPARVTPA